MLGVLRNFLASALILVATHTNAESLPQQAEPKPVKDTYYGQVITDPYRWLEDLKSAKTQAWMKSQATYAQAYLNKLPQREAMYKELTQLTSASAEVFNIKPHGEWFFYERQEPNEQDSKLYRREGLQGKEQLLLDPNKIVHDGQRYSINSWEVSFDGQYLSYQLAAGGSEQGAIRVLNLATLQDTGTLLKDIEYGAGYWLADSKSLVYPRLQKLAQDAPEDDKYKKVTAYRHVLGTQQDQDLPVFGYFAEPKLEIAEDHQAAVLTHKTWNYALGVIVDGTAPEHQLYMLPLSSLSQNKPLVWQKLADVDEQIIDFSIHDDDLYVVSAKQAPRYKIMRFSLNNPTKQAEFIYAGSDKAIISTLAAQPDALYVELLEGGNRRIERIDYQSKQAQTLPLPYAGSTTLGTQNSESNSAGVYFLLSTWNKSAAHFLYQADKNQTLATGLKPSSPISMADIEFINVQAPSHDGVMIPMVIIYKKGLAKNGKNPTLMDGYGAYETENTSPFFYPALLPWLERGGIFVLTGVRGGGEYGKAWYEAGLQATKANTWKDFIACARYLIQEKYTSSDYLAMQGSSAGGVLVVNTLAEEPALFKAAISNVGMTNVLRFETTANGLPNVPEFGSVKTQEGFKHLLAMDGYLKLKPDTSYPATLFIHGVNDPRVDVWMSSKMAARLQATTNNQRPILLRLDYDAGHGFGSTKDQLNQSMADSYAFLWEQLQPTNPP
ncbi:MAG: prolyl oligopeptidase family serine peptidase [Thiolinea sp.]